MQQIKNIVAILCALGIFHAVQGQATASFADSIRKQYHIPELAYAVLSSGEILEVNVSGVQKINTALTAGINDKFRIGSNTKAITGFIAAQLVHGKKISWDTRFFDLFPELKAKSNPAYHHLTLLNLLTFRASLFPYTYTYSKPSREQFSGDEAQQRYQFAAWFFQHKPVKSKDSIHFSNLGYVAAGLMLEKVSGKSYKALVADLGQELGINFGFGNPNAQDTLQPWGHDGNLMPEAPGDNYKLNWLLCAGNINVSLPDYAQFIQLQLKGLCGQSELLTQEEFNFLHFGLPQFAVGWFWNADNNHQTYSYNIGNPGTFLSKVFVFKDQDRAFILFANAQTADADAGLDVLYEELKRKYSR
ncbi:MAG: serine hydrolase [Chitinophagaceae bacterium]|nr:serine hydrolase [Chitinophagaceae bacterium]